MNPEALERLLTKVQTGTLSVATAIGQLRTLPYENLGFASVDHHRSLRQGFPEVIFCEGKTSAQIRAIAKALLKHHRPLLATRATRQVAALIKRLDRRAVYHDEARIVSIRDPKRQLRGHVLVITAGTSDIPVAEEARVTAEVMGSRVETLYDVGVAGIHRLLERQSRLMQARVVVVVAGMDGVLPSVVGGLVPCPVVAVPTSRGYGASFGGLAALLTMLNSCAAGVGVMNIDNGFGAGGVRGELPELREIEFCNYPLRLTPHPLRLVISLPPFPVLARQPSVFWDPSRRSPVTWLVRQNYRALLPPVFSSGPTRPRSGGQRCVEGRRHRSRRREAPGVCARSENGVNFSTAT